MGRLVRGNLRPRMVGPPPGPKSRELSLKLGAAEAPGINTLGANGEPTVVWEEALGANVLDVDGNVYVDLTSGFGVAAIGHRHPRVIAAISEQAGRLLHGLGDVAAHPARVALAARLAAVAPVEHAVVHFAVSGADAVEIALKTALAATGRARILAFEPSYHGATLGALSLSSRPEFRAPAAPLLPEIDRLPYGAPVERIDALLAGGDFAAVVVEPIVGREGVIVPPPGWLYALSESARKRGALLVADEILTGFGRTGELFAVQRESVRPDLLCCGKALGGGLPLAAVVGSRALMEVWRPDPSGGEALHTGTFVAHPLAMVAALAAFEALAHERLIERAAAIGRRIQKRLAPLVAQGAPLGVVDCRGVGALWGLELADARLADAVALDCRERGVLLLVGGAERRVIELLPPLVVTDDQLDVALEILAGALERARAPAER